MHTCLHGALHMPVLCASDACIVRFRCLHCVLHMPALCASDACTHVRIGACCAVQQDDLPQIRSMLPKPDELAAVQAGKAKALQEYGRKLKEHRDKVSAVPHSGASDPSQAEERPPACSHDSSGDGPSSESVPVPPRLGVVEAAFEALGGVKMLMAKMRACEFK